MLCRAPQGARGLKFSIVRNDRESSGGRAPQGARGLKYIMSALILIALLSRPARGAWVEIHYGAYVPYILRGRAPQGARGLKCDGFVSQEEDLPSRPARGAWVEIFVQSFSFLSDLSRPARGAWVEISPLGLPESRTRAVAPRKGRVG